MGADWAVPADLDERLDPPALAPAPSAWKRAIDGIAASIVELRGLGIEMGRSSSHVDEIEASLTALRALGEP